MAFDGYKCKNGRGFAAILTFQRYSPANSQGSSLDRKCENEHTQLKDLLPHFGYNVGYAEIDPPASAVEALLEQWNTHSFEAYDSFLLVISAHGDQEGVFTSTENPALSDNEDHVEGTDRHVKINYEVFEQALQFNRTLSCKPKWLVFACCHGLNPDPGMVHVYNFAAGDSRDSASAKNPLLPTHVDTLVTHASVSGYCAFRTVEGTVLLQKLLERFHCHKLARTTGSQTSASPQVSVMQLCFELNASVAEYLSNSKLTDLDKRKQMCEHVNRLRADFFLTYCESPVEQLPYKHQPMKRKTLTVRELSDLIGHLNLTPGQKQDYVSRLSDYGIDIATP